MRRAMKVAPLAVLCALIIAVPSVWAYWVQDGAAVCTWSGDQRNPTILSDGAGGAFITWQDYRNGTYDIYAQRLNASGVAQWATDGVAICTANGDQVSPAIISDGAGGAIVAWQDGRNGTSNYDIYVQRVNASGVVQWTTNGVALCTAGGNQQSPTLVSDGLSGAIVAWQDYRSGSNWDIYAQRVFATGGVGASPNGVALCAATGDQTLPTIATDGAGGAFVTWQDYRSASNFDIYAQRVNGTPSVQWAANGVALCATTGDQWYPTIIFDGVGNAIVTWEDYRSGSANDIYAQRVNASGILQWGALGIAICTYTGDQQFPAIVSDGAGGAIITWQDNRGASADIYAQRVNSTASLQWTTSGVPLCTSTGDQYSPTIASDGANGAIVTWYDIRSWDIYAQRVSSSGAVQWTSNGMALCTATGNQQYPTITSDGEGGAVVTWYDARNGNNDIYAQAVDAKGRAGFLAPSIHTVKDVPGDQGGQIYLSWYGARSDVFMDGQVSYYSIWRAIKPTKALLALENGASSLDDLSKLDRSSEKGVIRVDKASNGTFFWELMNTMDALFMPAYGEDVSTLFDSTSICKEYSYFQVVAHTSVPTVFWASAPDSGYSVDNFAPGVPKALAGKQSAAPAGLDLTWERNREPDLDVYHVYRGLTAGFIPGPASLISSPRDTTLLDTGWRWNAGYYYKVSAVDVHGNESGFALLAPDDVSGSETPKAPAASYLAQNFPNPFNPMTRIDFGLSGSAHVSLRIYDASGRLVRALVNEERRAGTYVESWDGRDSGGRAVASGIYFYRLDAGAFESTKKMILVR